MNFGEVIRVVARRWFVILGMFLAGIVVSGLVVFKVGAGGITPRDVSYTSSADILLDQPKLAGAAATAAMGRLLVLPQTFIYVIQSQDIAERASQKLNGVYSAADIKKCTSASATLGTQVMNVSSCGDNPSDAQAVTNAVLEATKDWLNQRQDDAGVLGANRLAVVVLSAPQVPAGPSGFPPAMWVFIGGFAGLLLGLLFAFGMESVQSAAAPEAPLASLPAEPATSAFPQTGNGAQVSMLSGAQSARLRRPRRSSRTY